MDNADYSEIGYSLEGTPGTDPATQRLAFPGDITTFEPNYTYDKKTRWRPHSRDPAGSYATWFDTSLHIEMLPFDEFNAGANSMLALAVGSAPDAGTGVITNQNNLRTFTVQHGWDLPTTDVWRRIRYCMIDTYELTIEEKEPVKLSMDILGISHPTNDQLTDNVPWGAVPATYDGAPWASTGHVTWTITAQTFTGDIVGGKITLKNHVGKIAPLNQTGITATKTFTGARRQTSGSFNFVPEDSISDWSVFIKDPGNPANRFDQVINFSKDYNADATLEGMNLSIPQCVTTPNAANRHHYNAENTDALQIEWNWEHVGGSASPIAFRVKP